MEYDEIWHSWQSAHDLCSQIPGDFRLPVPLNDAENNFLRDFLVWHPSVSSLPLGITDKDAEGTWVNFYTGEVLKYTNWRTGKPDNNYGSRLLQIYSLAST